MGKGEGENGGGENGEKERMGRRGEREREWDVNGISGEG